MKCTHTDIFWCGFEKKTSEAPTKMNMFWIASRVQEFGTAIPSFTLQLKNREEATTQALPWAALHGRRSQNTHYCSD